MKELAEPLIGAKYIHKKGMPYRVLDVAMHSEALEKLVIYETLYENPLGDVWARPLSMFMEAGRFTLQPPELFKYYHAHVYFKHTESNKAAIVRQNILDATNIQNLRAHPLINQPIGPHPLPMFEIDFSGDFFWDAIQLLSQFRDGLSVLIHPLSGNEWEDHTLHAMFLGRRHDLKLEILRGRSNK